MTSTRATIQFWDRHAARYSKSPIADEAAYQTKLDVTRRYFRPDMEVLEFGCGTGGTAIKHSPFVRHIEAIDFSHSMLEIAQTKAEAQGVTNVTFQAADIVSFDRPDGSYGAILGMSILHLLEDKDAVIAKVFRLLEPGGVFISSTMCLSDVLPIFKLLAPVGRLLGLMPVLDIMTSKQLLASLTEAGFVIEHQWLPGKGKALFIVARKPA